MIAISVARGWCKYARKPLRERFINCSTPSFWQPLRALKKFYLSLYFGQALYFPHNLLGAKPSKWVHFVLESPRWIIGKFFPNMCFISHRGDARVQDVTNYNIYPTSFPEIMDRPWHLPLVYWRIPILCTLQHQNEVTGNVHLDNEHRAKGLKYVSIRGGTSGLKYAKSIQVLN